MENFSKVENQKTIQGLSKLSKEEKISFIQDRFFTNSKNAGEILKSFWHSSSELQEVFDQFSENTLSNFYMPYGIVPNFLMNGKVYCIPMAIEESSVVAAASKSAKFWYSRGGFQAKVLSTQKNGQVHLSWRIEPDLAKKFFESVKDHLKNSLFSVTENMEKRGGGLLEITLLDKTDLDDHYFQVFATFETCDAMGANFINTALEKLAKDFQELVYKSENLSENQKDLQVIMSILSNYTPDCLVEAKVSCSVENFVGLGAENSRDFAYKFKKAVDIARLDPYRGVTHNKGILNGVDGLILATGNDFRAVEASCHAYASRKGCYQSLSFVELEGDILNFILRLPLSVGTVGGLTSLHPLAKFSLELLGRPSAPELMMLSCSIGLAQNFGAVTSLVTSGIQKGHMKMHLMNILNHLGADDREREKAVLHFKTEVVSYSAVRAFLSDLRTYH